MIHASLLDALFAATDPSGLDLGDERVRASASGSLNYTREGDSIFVTITPAATAAKEGLLGRFARGSIRKVRIDRNGVSVFIEDLPVVGTVEKRIEVRR